MAATYNSCFKSHPHNSPPLRGNTNHTNFCGVYQSNNIDASLAAEEGQRPILNYTTKFENDEEIEDAFAQLEDVAALIRGYSHSVYDENDDKTVANESFPILLSGYNDFEECQLPRQASIHDEDEIIYGFMPRKRQKHSPQNGGAEDEEGALWERIEAEAEAMCESEGISTSNRDNRSPFKSSSSHATSKNIKKLTGSGVAALINYAETELNRLRIGALELIKPLPQEVAGSSGLPPTTPLPPPLPREDEKTTDGEDNLACHFRNQMAHEKALLELLQSEHNRVRSEVGIAQRQCSSTLPDVVNQFRHLRERLQQQRTLIDDLEYRYLEDKTKYDEEKQNIVALLKLRTEVEAAPLKALTFINGTKGTISTVLGDICPEDTSASSTVAYHSHSPPQTNSPTSFSDLKDCPTYPSREDYFADSGASSKATEEGLRQVIVPASQIADDIENNDLANFSPAVSTTSPALNTQHHPQSKAALMEHKFSLPLEISPTFQPQNGLSSGLHRSCTSLSSNIIHPIPPSLPSSNLSAEQCHQQTATQCSDRVQIRRRQRACSAATRCVWQNNEVRPLTRYLPVPDDITFDLRHHLQVTCGHILCSPLVLPHLQVDATTCAGYLYKVDSRITATTNDYVNSMHLPCLAASSNGGIASTSPTFSSTTTKGTIGAITSKDRGGFMAAFFHRSRRGKRRWFVLDRKRRLLIYYPCRTIKSLNSASLVKPKDVISFTDIIDVYPDRQAQKNTGFSLLLVASNPSHFPGSQRHQKQTLTRTLSLAAPSKDVTRVWIDALFTCAGAYLCLLNNQDKSRKSKPE